MKFYCETYHEERDTEHCRFCSAACSQRPTEETVSSTGEKTMRQRTEKITIVFTYDEMPLGKATSKTHMRKIEVYGTDLNGEELLFSETESETRGIMRTKSGVAGAVNLLYGLLFNLPNTYYVNDDRKENEALARKVADALKKSH